MTTPVDIDAVLRAAEKATARPWFHDYTPNGPGGAKCYKDAILSESYPSVRIAERPHYDSAGSAQEIANAAFIVLACNSVVAMAEEIRGLRARVALLDALIGNTQDFLKHLLAGKSQYYFGDRLMANGEQHAKELDQHIKAALKETP